MSIAAYQQTILDCDDPRRIEYRLFLRITLALERFREADWRSEGLKDALYRNMELWGWLRADLLDDENGLPEKLRAGLVSLSYTVDRQTRAVLQGMAGVGLLVEINRAVMQGLQGTPQPATEVADVA
ncbi:flagellar biosynthesis regulator FlaF [Azospirillum doebereinerae]|uniref:Flagellar biosynthesis regulatory protein FlaF n=1 Tax=Azospirillum doebereinerae TaxID=92933 RepID=A0A433J410_9PROT|nr:flagellar biosynthesis regulator FlaF [Azospirillum doebereinerae]MCG5243500.1 flagellar biosynthesis regulator FlaF [Azospirillum doebereinerae]RUQ66605.1 flagellar biosynthesis regulatory protein FlaF [Azospirillum doebereinerae]